MKMYARREPDGSYTLRQERYRGTNHPHDVCAVARSLEELKDMCAKHWPDADYERSAGMSSRTLHLDVESYSTADLKAVGVENYIQAPGFAVTVMAWAFDDGPVQSEIWPHCFFLPEDVRTHIEKGGLVTGMECRVRVEHPD